MRLFGGLLIWSMCSSSYASIHPAYKLTSKYPCHPNSQVKCESGFYVLDNTTDCIQSTKLCDGHFDCTDGSDEKYCVGNFNYGRIGFAFRFVELECNIHTLGYFCKYGNNKYPGTKIKRNCFSSTWLCDQEVDCYDGFDEIYCPYSSLEGFHYEYVRELCPVGYYMCPKGELINQELYNGANLYNTCIKKEEICDGRAQCTGGSEEFYCPYFFSIPREETTTIDTPSSTSRWETTSDSTKIPLNYSSSLPPENEQQPALQPTLNVFHFHNIVIIFMFLTIVLLSVIIVYFCRKLRKEATSLSPLIDIPLT